ncbi:hypothetical protein KI387_039916, partial [Taxus chinensis]
YLEESLEKGASVQAFGLTSGSGAGQSSGSGALSQIIDTQFSGTVGVLEKAPIGPIRPSGFGGSSGSRGTGPTGPSGS